MADTTNTSEAAVAVAEKYYDSEDADRFYSLIWGGEDIHVGLYEQETTSIRDASHRTLELMADLLGQVSPDAKVLDIGAGYGGAGRFLAERFGCHVTSLNLSEVQNEKNRELSKAAGLDDKVDVVHGNFESLPFDDDSFDVIWAQDAILHSGDREQVLKEVKRTLRSGGRFIFTDPMQADDCPEGVIAPVLERLHLNSLASKKFYREALAKLGFEEIKVLDLTEHLGRHYASVGRELASRRESLRGQISDEYVDRMLKGLDNWVNAERSGYLAWGILHFRAP